MDVGSAVEAVVGHLASEPWFRSKVKGLDPLHASTAVRRLRHDINRQVGDGGHVKLRCAVWIIEARPD